ncbi:type II toxin-antitoxin system PemK/MazF family toxin [Arhodomonas sp. SL1]|uniref:type II toxin-antitoxin system PemK/MazF family toxin n=1 Tax=Arhodomonas sp. SL1 TaxID=3425691 RepID=UPI003F884EEA
MRRGEVWVANLNPNRGREIGKMRPVLIMQHDALLALNTGMLIVLPLTTQARPSMAHFRPRIPARDRLLRESYVVVEQPRTLDAAYIGDGPLTTLSTEEMVAVERGLSTALGIV